MKHKPIKQITDPIPLTYSEYQKFGKALQAMANNESKETYSILFHQIRGFVWTNLLNIAPKNIGDEIPSDLSFMLDDTTNSPVSRAIVAFRKIVPLPKDEN